MQLYSENEKAFLLIHFNLTDFTEQIRFHILSVAGGFE